MNNKNLKYITECEGLPMFYAGHGSKQGTRHILENGKLKLFSFLETYYIQRYILGKGYKVFIDSGAFTFWKMKRGLRKAPDKIKDITEEEYLNQYIDYINQHEDSIIFAAQLDCIPNSDDDEEIQRAADVTWENYRYMRTKVNNPDILLPVYHIGEDISNLQRMIDFGCEYVALGGLVGKSRKQKEEFLDYVFEYVKNSNNPNLMIHGFGLTIKDLLVKYPFTSCDSTSWMIPANNGQIVTDLGTYYMIDSKKNEKKHIDNIPVEERNRLEEYVVERGYTFELLKDYTERQKMFLDDMFKWNENYKYKGRY